MEEDSIRETFNSLDLTHSYWSLNIALDQLEHIKIVIYYINVKYLILKYEGHSIPNGFT